MVLRAYIGEDSAILSKWLRTETELYQWSADRLNKFPLTEKDIDDHYAPQLKTGRFIPLTAVDEKDHVMGHFIIRYPKENDDRTVRFGFVIVNPALRGKGYGKEMLLLGIEYVKENLMAKRIDLGVFANNDSALHCYESIGFKEYNRRKCEMPIGVWACVDMEILVE
ncbi:MAG: GNAT family N-acetyltransferase [Clostridia bacterium]|nr:GNAT family N-acetyltransferase [Clostridia bacterium]